jgi:hypothetical protein
VGVADWAAGGAKYNGPELPIKMIKRMWSGEGVWAPSVATADAVASGESCFCSVEVILATFEHQINECRFDITHDRGKAQVGGSEVNVAVATAKYDDCSSSSRDDTEINFAPLDALTRDEGPIYIGGLSP